MRLYTKERDLNVHLCNIFKIRHILSQQDAEKLVHAFVTSRLDYCIFFIFWLPV